MTTTATPAAGEGLPTDGALDQFKRLSPENQKIIIIVMEAVVKANGTNSRLTREGLGGRGGGGGHDDTGVVHRRSPGPGGEPGGLGMSSAGFRRLSEDEIAPMWAKLEGAAVAALSDQSDVDRLYTEWRAAAEVDDNSEEAAVRENAALDALTIAAPRSLRDFAMKLIAANAHDEPNTIWLSALDAQARAIIGEASA